MTLRDLKFNNFSIWIVGILMVIIPFQCYWNPELGVSAMRISQAQIFQVSSIVIFCLFILQNIYLSLFLLWSLFIYGYYGFPNPSGTIVLSILGSCLIYEAVYRVVNHENMKVVFKFMIWFAIINMIYMAMQGLGWELLYQEAGKSGYQNGLLGFFGLKAIMGMFFAMAIPFVAFKYPKLSLGLFIPIYVSECSCAMGAAIVAYLWQIWNISRKWFYILVGILCIGGIVYAIHDSEAGMFTDRGNLWKVVMRDAVRKPIFGWGIDSFRCATPDKQFMYWKNVRTRETFKTDIRDTIEYQHTGMYDLKKYGKFMQKGDILDPWDNPHNEFIMLFYEFGIFPFVILGFFIYDIKRRFNTHNDYLVPFIGFFLGLLIMSMGQFPFHLARIGIYIPIFLACYYKLTESIWNS